MVRYACIVVAIMLCTYSSSVVYGFNFDDLNAGTNDSSIKTDTLKGAKGESQKSLQRQHKVWQAEEEAEKRAAEAAAARYRAERALGNGNRHYDCEFSCRTNGFILYDGTDKMKQRVKANESWEAEKIVKENADKICRNIRGRNTGSYMWETGLRCTEVR